MKLLKAEGQRWDQLEGAKKDDAGSYELRTIFVCSWFQIMQNTYSVLPRSNQLDRTEYVRSVMDVRKMQ